MYDMLQNRVVPHTSQTIKNTIPCIFTPKECIHIPSPHF